MQLLPGGWIDEIIDPRESRDHLRRALLAAGNKRSTRPPRKHGNIPL
jgi:propionyl-CoA carboxylase beta chain